jgi:hypothetical protein
VRRSRLMSAVVVEMVTLICIELFLSARSQGKKISSLEKTLCCRFEAPIICYILQLIMIAFVTQKFIHTKRTIGIQSFQFVGIFKQLVFRPSPLHFATSMRRFVFFSNPAAERNSYNVARDDEHFS